MVRVDGVNTGMGRWPNLDAPNGGYRLVTSHVGNTSFTDSSLTGTIDWTGAEVVLRKQHWVLDRNLVTSQVGGTITFKTVSSGSAHDGYGYFIQNDPRTLDQSGEWYFDPKTKTLKMYFGAAGPATSKVEVSVVDTLVEMKYADYIGFDGIALEGANVNAFDIGSSSHVTLQSCDIDFSGKTAIWGSSYYGLNSDHFKLEASTIDHTNNDAIDLGGEFVDAAIRHNTIRNTGLIGGMGIANGDETSYQGMQAYHTTNLLFEYNEIDATGYSGISIDADNAVVQKNFINHSCMVKDDCAGIYTANNTGKLKFLNNIVLGNVTSTAGAGGGVPLMYGLYTDDNSSYVEVAGNTSAFNAFGGMQLHNAHQINVHDNVFYDNTIKQMYVSSDDMIHGWVVKNVSMHNNTFVSRAADQVVVSLNAIAGDFTTMGVFDQNIYTRPIDDNITLETVTTYKTSKSHTLATWQVFLGQDAQTKKGPKAITTLDALRFEYNATDAPVTVALGADYIGVDGTAYKQSVQLAPYASVVLIKN